MVLNKLLTSLFCLCLLNGIFAQKGKDGAKLISTSTIVNEFSALTTNAISGTNTITVASNSLNFNSRFPSSLKAGDLIMIIQMQGALIKLSAVPVWAPDSTYGKIYSYENCGNYEFAEVKSIISTTQIELVCGLKYSYNTSGKTQIVRVPRYNTLNINLGGILSTDNWNGTIGGIVCVEVNGGTTINSGGLISADGSGFRGGVAANRAGNGNSSFATKNPNDGAEKGEGIGSQRLINSATTNDTLGKQCKGAPGNGGGGGNANNCGGGGGGNGGNITTYNGYGICNTSFSTAFNLEWAGRAAVVSSGGGKGGYGTSTVVANPNVIGPNNATWSSNFKRPSYGGFGGRPLDYSTGKIFIGGGGGAGHKTDTPNQSNGANACSGGSGGGLVYILSYGTISGTGTISANGSNGGNAAGNSILLSQGIDGAGGAGAGGTIILESSGTISSITANAKGGNGGDQIITIPNNEGQGPGGGGSGGYIASNGSVFTQNVSGGLNGTTNSAAFDTEFPMNGATSGDNGTANQTILNTQKNIYTLSASPNQTICTSQSANITATSTNSNSTIEWYNSETGGPAISTGTLFTTPAYASSGTYTVFAGSCPGLYRIPIIITVNNGANISITGATTVCPGQTATLTASGVNTYTWMPGNIVSNIYTITPTAVTIVTVTGSNGNCTSQNTATVTVTSGFSISINNPTICAGQSVVLTPTSSAISYTWSTNQSTPSITVSPTTTTIYTVTGLSGACSGVATTTVTVNSVPTLTVNSANICVGQSATLTALGANTYTWSNGVNGNSQTVNPTTTTFYTVTGTGINGCVNTIVTTATVNVGSAPNISVNSTSLCIGQTATLTASGSATSYTWSSGGTTNTETVSPVTTTIYTLSASNGGCSTVTTATVYVDNTVITTYSQTLNTCPSQSVTIYATGTNSTTTTYTWSNGVNTYSQTVAPVNTTTYVVNGLSSSGCPAISGTVIVNVNPITADFSGVNNTVMTVGEVLNLVNTSTGHTSITWNYCYGTSSANQLSVPLADTGRCCITLLASNATCTNSVTKCVNVIQQATIIIPNVFTPNGDGENELFKIKSSGIKNLNCVIFDRWGLKMYEWEGINGYWDGNAKNGKATSGTYFYIINYTNYNDESKTEKGFLNLFKD